MQSYIPSTTPCELPARLVALAPSVEPRIIALFGSIADLGRSADRSITVADIAVSRRHALVVRADGIYLLQDAGSTNGTFLNGERLAAPRPLQHGDLIGLGQDAPHLRFIGPGRASTSW